MGRLIDAEAFKKQVAAMCIKNNGDTDRATALIEWINLQPTAFDMNKVVERLEEASYNEMLFDEDGFAEDGVEIIHLDKAIEIVKAGGIDD